MKRDIAEQLVTELIDAAKALDRAEIIARGIDDEDEQMKIRRAIAKVGASAYTQIMCRIFEDYPELEPSS